VAIPVLGQTLKRSRSTIVKMHTAWALGKIGGHEAKLILKQASKMNPKPEVRREMESALKRMKTY